MIAYMQADRPTAVDLYLWLKDDAGTYAVYPTDKAVVWKGITLTSTRVRRETKIAMRLTPGTTYNVASDDQPAGSPAPNIKNPLVDGRQFSFTY